METLSAVEARRAAIAAQGFSRGARSRVTRRSLAGLIRRLGLLQIDFVNVVAPAHLLVPFSRLGAFPLKVFDAAVYGGGQFTEQWAHVASIIPVETWPLLRHRMESFRLWPSHFEQFLRRRPDYREWVIAQVRERGPLSAAGLPDFDGIERRMPGTWFRSVPRAALEALFARGVLGIAARRPDMSRVYDLAERLIPPALFCQQVTREDAGRRLLLTAARACGAGTAADLADYFRMSVKDARPRIEELAAAGQLREVRVEGWRERAWLYPGALESRPAPDPAALLCPFDPLIWFRPRVARLFGFDYRMEVFIPAAQRRWGCYVFPFLMGDRLVARVDLKSDRPSLRLLVLNAEIEDHAGPAAVAPALAAELQLLAGWLGLTEGVAVTPRHRFAAALRRALR